MNDIDKWIKKFQRMIDSMPEGYEAIVSYGSIDIHPKGALDKHMEHNAGFGMHDPPIGEITTGFKVLPYSEGA